jgi:hypothetical protein
MKVDSRSSPESIDTPKSKSICGGDGDHKLLLFWNPNVSLLSVVPKQQKRIHIFIL